MPDALSRALAAGATVVTPNRRLARHLVDEFDRAQRAAGRRAWPSASVLPWHAWVGAMLDEAMAAGATPSAMSLSPEASALVWRAAVDADGLPHLDPGGLAMSAAEAWNLVHAYGAGGESWRSWAGGTDEPAAFARWAEHYRAVLAAQPAIDAATASDHVARAAPAMLSWRERHVVFAGFVEPTPQMRRLGTALSAAGVVVEAMPTLPDRRARLRRVEFVSARSELRAAMAWARGELERHHDARLGIVIPDLGARLAEVRFAALDVLGEPADGASASQAWNVSLGAPIDAVPLVSSALDAIALAWTALPAGRAAALLRGAFLPAADGAGRSARAAVERRWIDAGIDPVRASDVVAALERGDPALGRRIAGMRSIAARHERETRHGWVDAWRDAHAAVGWPGDVASSSEDHQARAAFDEHLVRFASLDAVSSTRGRGGIAAGDAIAEFAAMLARSPFQPESPPAPIQIVGLYESIGLPFDGLWIAGMNDETLPRAPRPHPFLPMRWQREHAVPRSDAVHEFAYAREIVSWWLRAAPDAVVSHATTLGDRMATRSAIFPPADPVSLPVPPSRAETAFAARPPRERQPDASAPAWRVEERIRGGAGVVAAQSDCPFQALAARRWRADPWPQAALGLTPMERGNLAHAALAAFWRVTGDQAGLEALVNDPPRFLSLREATAREAIATIDASRWRRVPPAVRANEEDRLARLLAEWLIEVDLRRPPFSEVRIEFEASLSIGPLDLALRLDRIDTLADGGVAIIDYKTGDVPPISRWRGDRPEATQVALYTLAWRSAHPEPARAAVLAKVRRGEVKATGLYADEAARFSPAARGEKASPVVDASDLHDEWARTMRALVDAFARGDAEVAPRDASVCRRCARHALCRVADAPSIDTETDA